MYHYKIYNMRLAADLPFPHLLKAPEGPAEIIIQEGPILKQLPPHSPKQQYNFGNTRSWLENRTCYLLIEHGRHITYQRKTGCNETYLRTYLLGWGLSMLSLQLGKPAIHCSAISKGASAVLICGESGSGKSTTTTALLKQGYRLMADDMSLAEYREGDGVYATAAFPYQKLCRDAAVNSGVPMDELIYIDEDKDKFLVPCKEIFDERPQKIKAMIILYRTGGEKLLVYHLQGMDTFYACANNLFLRHLLKEQKYSPSIGEACLKIASCVPMYVIGRPDGKDTVEEVTEQIQNILVSPTNALSD